MTSVGASAPFGNLIGTSFGHISVCPVITQCVVISDPLRFIGYEFDHWAARESRNQSSS
ncbi:MAG: hypothetical protein HY774_00430 [Acidobacteria bacterium]|nr:hypothetical protein [Acidobacteriota bacterium]